MRETDCSPRSPETAKSRASLRKNMSMSTPLVLSFDLDDSLWPVGPVIAAAESELLSWLRARYPLTVSGHGIESMRALRAGVAERYPDRGHDLTFLRHRALKDLFAAAGHAGSPADETPQVFFTARNRVEFYDDIRPSLIPPRSPHLLFTLTNRN